MLLRTACCAFIICMCFASSLVTADEVVRPKIGLALSGGGARGAAHIGVLKQLEALKIPIDYIAGTSIGSIIGGLYASGYTAAELEVLIDDIDWDSAFSDQSDRASLPMRQKLDETDFLIDFELGVDKRGVSIPKGVLQGQKLRLVLNDIFRGVMLIDDFDQLPIPFRAVASDIEHGKPVVLQDGDIISAVQASMAVPGVFAPVEINGTMLVDGGVTNNLPVDVVREMGADIVIAVDISTPLIAGKNLLSAIDILDQLTNILNQANVRERVDSLTDKDFFIQPDLRAISSANFNLVLQGVKEGEKAIEPYRHELSKLAIDSAQYASYRELITRSQSRTKTLIPDYVSVRQDSHLSSDAIRSRLRTEPTLPIDRELLHEDIGRIYGLGIFQTVSYRLQKDHGLVGLVIEANEKDWGPNYVKFGFQLEDDFDGGNDYNLLAGFNRKPINALGGEVSGVVKAGGEPKLGAEYFQPFNSLAETYGLLLVDSGQNAVNIYEQNSKLARYRVREVEAGAFLGVQYSRSLDVRLGLKRSYGSASLSRGDESFDSEVSFDGGAVALEVRYDTLDSRSFPKSGNRGSFTYERNTKLLGADDAFAKLEWDGISVTPLGVNRLAVSYRLASTVEGAAPVQSLSRLGGFQKLSGYSKNEFAGAHAGLLGVALYRPVIENYFEQFQHPVYVGASIEAGNVWQRKSEIKTGKLLYSASVFVGTQTPLGPLYLGFGQAEEGQSSMYFSLGHLF